MIHIKKSQAADTRSAKEKVSKETLLLSSIQHIGDVQKALHWMAERLLEVSEKHDHTKIDHLDEFYVDFRAIQEGRLKDFKDQHWFNDIHLTERHHLDDRVPDDVNLFDVLERIADCVMAGMGRSGNVYPDTLTADVLMKAFNNTYELLQSVVIVEEEPKP